MNWVIEWIGKWGPLIKPDPVKECPLYRNRGCSHVDGYLCDMKTCTELAKYREDFERGIHCMDKEIDN